MENFDQTKDGYFECCGVSKETYEKFAKKMKKKLGKVEKRSATVESIYNFVSSAPVTPEFDGLRLFAMFLESSLMEARMEKIKTELFLKALSNAHKKAGTDVDQLDIDEECKSVIEEAGMSHLFKVG